VAGAEILSAGSRIAVTAADGRFSIPNPGPIAVSLVADGYLTRRTRISGARTDLVIDLISLAPPFSLDYYRQLGRNAQDGAGGPLLGLTSWSIDPSVYIFANRITP